MKNQQTKEQDLNTLNTLLRIISLHEYEDEKLKKE